MALGGPLRAAGDGSFPYFRMGAGTFNVPTTPPPLPPPPAGALFYVLNGPSNGSIGQLYTATADVTGATGSVSFAVASGTLPPGLSLDPVTGNISGVLTAAGDYFVIVHATDSVGDVGDGSLFVAVNPVFSITGSPAAFATTGVGYSAQFSGVGGTAPFTFGSSGSLPPGLSIGASTGLLAGSPLTPGTFAGLSITGKDSAGNTAAIGPFSIVVSAPLSIGWAPTAGQVGISYETLPVAAGGQAPQVFGLAGTIPPGLSFSNATGALTGTPTTAGSFASQMTVTDIDGRSASSGVETIVIAPGVFAVPLTVAGSPDTTGQVEVSYSAQFSASGGSATGYSFSSAGAALPDGLTLNSSTGVLSGAPTTTGTFSGLVIQVSDSAANTAVSNAFTITVSPTPTLLLVTFGAPSAATEGSSYSLVFTAADGTGTGYVFTSVGSALPPGLSLNALNSAQTAISGTPTQAGTFNGLQIRVTDSGGHSAVSSVFSITVAAAQALVTVQGTGQGTATVRDNSSISGTLQTNLNQPIWTFTTSPPSPGSVFTVDGLSFIWSSLPEVAVPTDYIITATASKNPVSVAAPAFTIKVLPTLSVAGAPAGPITGFVGLPFNAGPYAASGVVGTPSFQLFQVFSDGELQDSIDIASLCPGLTLDGLTGTIAGLPTAPCDAELRMVLTDGFDHTTVTDGSRTSWPSHLVTLRTEGEFVTLVPDPAPILNIAADTATATLTSPSTVRVGAPVTGTLNTDLPAPVWSFVSSPPGLILTTDGNTFSGPSFSGVAPQVSSQTPFSVIATVTSGPVTLAAAPFTLTVAPVLALAGGPAADLGFTVGTPVVPTPAVTAGTTAIGALSLALVANGPVMLPAVCPGLVFDPVTGVVSGTPTATCALNGLQIQATDIDGATAMTAPDFALNVDGAIVVSGTPASGAVSEAYSFTPTVSGGSGSFVSYAKTDSSGTLAALGLSFSSATGLISGTATAVGSWSGTISATDSHGGSGTSSTLTVTVNAGLSISASTSSATGAVGETFISVTVTASGGIGAKTYSAVDSSGTLGALGLSIAPSTGTISGSSLVVGAWTGTVKVTDAGNATGAQTASITITINPGLTVVASATAVTGAVNEAFTSVTATPTGGSGTLTYSAVNGSGTLAALGLSISSTTGTISAGALVAGTWTGTIKVTDPGNPTGGQTASITITINATLAVSASATARTGFVGEAITSITATPTGGNGTKTFTEVDTSGTLGALGLSIAPSTGTISGSPTVTGSWSGTIKVTDPGNATGAQTESITITVSAGLSISGTPGNGTVGTAYSFTPVAAGGSGGNVFSEVDTTGTLTALGLTLSSSTGVVSGATPVAGTWTGSIKVTDTGGGTKSIAGVSIIVSNVLTLAGSPATATQSQDYSYLMTTITAGGRAPFTYTVTAGALPTGLAASSSVGNTGNLISGTVGAAATSTTPTFHVVDADGRVANATLTFTVNTPTSNAFAWGNDAGNQLGDNNTTSRSSPVSIKGSATYVWLSGGGVGGCGISSIGAPDCWGSNADGESGDGTTNNNLIHVTPTGVTGVTQIEVGGDIACALLTNHTVKCWGNNTNGDLGAGLTGQQIKGPTLVSGISTATQIAVSRTGFFACAVLTGGTLQCWGDNGGGQLGQNNFTSSNIPITVPLVGGKAVTQVAAAGFNFSSASVCVLLSDTTVQCWGSFNGSKTPVVLAGVTGVSMLVGGGKHFCGIFTGGAAKCWGFNGQGQLGDGTQNNATAPVQVSGLTSGVTWVAAGLDHSCAIVGGAAKCWGSDSDGQIGTGAGPVGGNLLTPQAVPGLASLSKISAGRSFTIAY